MTMLSELGITVTESDEPAAPEGEPAKARGNLDHDDIGGTDDPVRMYLRELRSVQLLSREGEVAIAKRIEAGRETMLGAIRESPLTFDAILGWRDALNEGKMLLRDIIDLNAAQGDRGFDSAAFVTPGEMVATPAAGCVTASKDQSAAETVEIGTELGVAEAKEGESSIPLAAMEAALILDITVTFDAMAQTQEKLDKLRHQRITNLGKREVLPRPTECLYDKHANRRGCHREASPRPARLRVAPLSRAWSRLHRRGSAPLRSARRRSALQNARSETRVPASSARAPAAPPLSTQVTCSLSLRMAAKAPFRPRPLGARPVLRGYPLRAREFLSPRAREEQCLPADPARSALARSLRTSDL